jgi:hypothetical protein
MKLKDIMALVVLGLTPSLVSADRISFMSPTQWQQWQMPGNAVEVTRNLGVKPVKIRKSINAVINAEAFDGGIRDAGSNLGSAKLVMDGLPETGWAPDPGTSDEAAYLEIDLGRLVTAERITIKMDASAPPFEFFKVLVSEGEKFFNVSDAPIEGSRVISFTESFGFNESHEIEVAFPRGSARFVRLEISRMREVDAASRFVEVEVHTVGDNIGLGLINRGGSIDLVTDLKEGTSLTGADRMVDGDITTVWFLNTLHQTTTGSEIFNRVIFDLGAHYWIDRFRVVGEPFHVNPRSRARSGNFFWYTIFASDGSTAPDGSLLWKSIAELPHDQANATDVRNFEHVFPLEKVRYVRHFYPSTDGVATGIAGGTHSNFQFFGLISEYQMFGEGFPAEIRLESPILDLGGLRAVTTLDWDAITPPGTRVNIRTRTGNQLSEETLFFDKSGKQITERKYDKTPPSLRGEKKTLQSIGGDWDVWSAPYAASGDVFKSASPRRYGQVEVLLLSDDPDVAPSIANLHLNVESPIALATSGEIFPQHATPGKEEEFTYFMLPTFGGESEGYDRLTLGASIPVEFVGLQIGGQQMAATAEDTEDGFSLDVGAEFRTSELVALTFRSTVFQNQTRFNLFLGNSRLEDVRQLVDAGDASDLVESETVAVSLPVNADLLANLQMSASVITPNGDGIGDQLRIQFDALKLVTPRPLRIEVFDLSGRLLRDLSVDGGLAQHYDIAWDGRDASGIVVTPGSYLLRLEVEGDSRSQTVQRLVSVAY